MENIINGSRIWNVNSNINVHIRPVQDQIVSLQAEILFTQKIGSMKRSYRKGGVVSSDTVELMTYS